MIKSNIKNALLCTSATILFCAAALADDDPGKIFDIPRVDRIVVDGDAEDWSDQGYRITTIRKLGGPTPTLKNKARIAWDQRGMLFLIEVDRGNPAWFEHRNPDKLWAGDAVELAISPRKGDPNVVQWLIAAGMSDPKADHRTTPYDFRADEDFKNVKLDVHAGVVKKKDLTGYTLEAMIPWDCIGVQPFAGREVAAQIVIDHASGPESVTQNVWFQGTKLFRSPHHVQRVRLADKPGPQDVMEVTIFKWDHRQNLVSLGISRVGDVNIQGPIEIVDQNGRAVTQAEYKGGRVDVKIPVPPFGKPYTRFVFKNRGEQIGFYDLDTDKYLLEQLSKTPLRFERFVFDGAQFPACEFSDQERARQLLGAYTLKTRFFNGAGKEVVKADQPGRYGAIVTYGNESAARDAHVTLYRTNGAAAGIEESLAKQNEKAVAEALEKNDAPSARLLAALYDRGRGLDKKSWSNSPDVRDQRWWLRLRHALGEDIKKLSPHVFAVKFPPEYDRKSGKRLGLLYYCPGRGFDCDGTWEGIANHTGHGIFRANGPCPFLTVMAHSFWGYTPDEIRRIMEIIEVLYPVDPHHVYIAGHSGGAEHARKFANSYPDRLAAVMLMAHGPWHAKDLTGSGAAELRSSPPQAELGAFNIDEKAKNPDDVASKKYFEAFSKRTFDWMLKLRKTLPEEK